MVVWGNSWALFDVSPRMGLWEGAFKAEKSMSFGQPRLLGGVWPWGAPWPCTPATLQYPRNSPLPSLSNLIPSSSTPLLALLPDTLCPLHVILSLTLQEYSWLFFFLSCSIATWPHAFGPLWYILLLLGKVKNQTSITFCLPGREGTVSTLTRKQWSGWELGSLQQSSRRC